jgi:hypothetical protein
MAAKASVSRQWVVRMVFTSTLFIGFGLWCIYDGTVTYPRTNAAVKKFKSLQEEGRQDEYPQLAAQKGWPEDPSHAEIKSDWDIRTQFIMAAPCILISGLSLVRVLFSAGRSMATDESGFQTVKGQLVPYDRIRRIDKRKWDRKGIADVFYETDSGNDLERTRVDAWIFAGGEEILKDVEANAQAEIVGQAPTSPPMIDDEVAENPQSDGTKTEETPFS